MKIQREWVKVSSAWFGIIAVWEVRIQQDDNNNKHKLKKRHPDGSYWAEQLCAAARRPAGAFATSSDIDGKTLNLNSSLQIKMQLRHSYVRSILNSDACLYFFITLFGVLRKSIWGRRELGLENCPSYNRWCPRHCLEESSLIAIGLILHLMGITAS